MSLLTAAQKTATEEVKDKSDELANGQKSLDSAKAGKEVRSAEQKAQIAATETKVAHLKKEQELATKQLEGMSDKVAQARAAYIKAFGKKAKIPGEDLAVESKAVQTKA